MTERAESTLLGKIRQAAADAGLDAVGVTDVAPFLAERRAIIERKTAGLHAGMWFTYGRPERSTTPASILAGARSIVVCARVYRPPEEDAPDVSGIRRANSAAVAAYVATDAYGELRDGLERISEILRHDGHDAQIVCDDNRLTDRAAAARAGLGWLGRNTMLLSRELGSWTVLGSVVTTAGLPVAAEAQPDGCGPCRRCQTACPTGALDEAGVLDARRCLAWLVQAPGAFPPEHRDALGHRIYGCDDCQVVCPYNDPISGLSHDRRTRSQRQPVQVGAGRDARRGSIDVVALLGMTDDDLMGTFGHWYIPRRRPEYLRRNALIVLGNVGDPTDPDVEEVVREALASPSAVVASHAVWAARRLGRDDLVEGAKAVGFLTHDSDGMVAAELARSTGPRISSG
ncbi:tRNA epoxyqueuosine(34) reductase QueG [Candidatus Poriferisodalis sp.]|uniref:tRNA epoxyqueuosine(34) reductase QueG n=1 Tax=Candidatus Poriferisodalis sp. TaxID=3101277 RepID=UPI003B01399D